MAKIERVNGPTPNGGEYAIAAFLDAKGDPIDKSKAARAEVVEYDAEGNVVWRTYVEVDS